jgi:hypothetical protein
VCLSEPHRAHRTQWGEVEKAGRGATTGQLRGSVRARRTIRRGKLLGPASIVARGLEEGGAVQPRTTLCGCDSVW